MPNIDERGTKMRNEALSVHAEMVRTSVVQPDKTVLWEGSVAAIFRKLNISQGYHTPIMRLLQRTDCLRQLRRGSRNVSSAFLLLRDPATMTESDWPSINSIVKSDSEGLTKATGAVILLTRRVKTLEDSLQGLNVKKALSEIQSQIDQLKDQITEGA